MAAVFSLVTVLVTVILHSERGTCGQGTDYYCSTDPNQTAVQIRGEEEGSIYTLYPGDTHYRNNQKCVWVIDAGPGHRVEITVLSSNLQWAHSKAICPGYDHVAIKDGQSYEDSVVLQWCGTKQPDGAVSTGQYLYVEFMSDNNNPYQYTGVHMRFKTFSSSECAPSWMSGAAEFCYKLIDKETDWSSAQRYCNSEGANLASVLSQNEQDFIQQSFGSSGDGAWIGLSDIAYPAKYQWIDGSSFSFSRFDGNHVASRYFRCVAAHFKSQSWVLKDCDKDTFRPLCKSNKGSQTDIFPVPQQQTDENGSKVPSGIILPVVIPVFVLVLIIVICVIVCVRRKRNQNPKSASDSSPSGCGDSRAVTLHNARAVQNPQPNAHSQNLSKEHVMTSDSSRCVFMMEMPTACCQQVRMFEMHSITKAT